MALKPVLASVNCNTRGTPSNAKANQKPRGFSLKDALQSAHKRLHKSPHYKHSQAAQQQENVSAPSSSSSSSSSSLFQKPKARTMEEQLRASLSRQRSMVGEWD
jgi:hypothetical protein